MDFYYPNRTNDFWKIMGLIFLNDVNALYNPATGQYDLPAIIELMTARGIALNDTARQVRRLRGNASDKFLEIVTPVPLDQLLAQMPECRAVVTTGEKAASVVAALTDTEPPKMGEMVTGPDGLHIWRMPSTSRAYPMKIEKKAEMYRRLFSFEKIL
ncbi:MAG: uracil-DNA glycosylase family protein [Muribaculaceae bacterium]|nr:uracil-DNA glycosylase family protein [Muribaculaceae bacterium]